jgi:hypothetical protein
MRSLLLNAWHIFLLLIVPLGIPVGAFLLWKRTRRVAALLQLVAAVLFFLCISVHLLRSHVDPFDKSWFSKLVRWDNTAVGLLSFILFAIGYLWFAIAPRNFNHPTAPTPPD